jgi:hypothetical protein
MIFKNMFLQIIEEQNLLKTTKSKPIVDAIKKRIPITFYYSGPRKPKKDSVKAGYRVKAEAVALGLSKKGNLIVRAWVQPPSTSKKGFSKHGWRTFIVGRMNNVQVLKDEQFDSKRPQYKEGDDRSMTVTYVTADWTKTPEPPKPEVKPTKKVDTTKPIQEPKPVEKPVEPKPEELPQPKPEVKPQAMVEPPKEEPKPEEEPTEPQQDELPQPKPEVKPSKTPEGEEDENLQESLKRIKRLMFS